MRIIIKTVKREIKYKECECCLENKKVKDNLIGYKCLCSNKH